MTIQKHIKKKYCFKKYTSNLKLAKFTINATSPKMLKRGHVCSNRKLGLHLKTNKKHIHYAKLPEPSNKKEV